VESSARAVSEQPTTNKSEPIEASEKRRLLLRGKYIADPP
jgi:hypothetical protein